MNKKRVIKERAKKEQTLSAKERSRIHRERKKKYYDDLERRVHELEEENRKLKERIKMIASNTSPKIDPLSQLHQEENFMYRVLPKVISQNPDQFRMSMYETGRDIEGPNGSLRVKVIKDAFRKIIDNCMSPHMKFPLAAFTHIEPKKVYSTLKDIARNNRVPYKYYRADNENQGQGEMQSSHLGEKVSAHRYFMESLLYKYPFSERMVDCWIYISPRTKKFCFTMRKLVKNLVKVRNQMLNAMKEIHKCFFEAKMYESYTKQDLVNIHLLSNDLKGSEVIDPLHLFQLSPKSPDTEDYKNDEISCTED
ncbi:unnamed protein product [Moneuplotes crassus]|uniref:BZIP domain-containing protein n=2 Tax=Euplotes crassus TaxID=5936 RepID=A0AAD2CWY2_EUPCR|nr:unnamed protein product [Moneuplotes crassus]